jgi:2-keto-4-pentenoate hydratase
MINKLYTPFKKGMIIISGSLTPPLQAVVGEYKFEIDNLGTAEFKILD